MLGLDKLVDLILQFAQDLKFWETIDYYDRGIKLRFGKPIRDEEYLPIEYQPGLHWKLPFIDKFSTIMVKTTTMPLREQTITTLDNISVVVKAVIKYDIKNAPEVLLEVNDPIDAVADMTQGIIRNVIVNLPYKDCNQDQVSKDIKDRAKREADKWGIRIREVTLTDLGKMTSIRLLSSAQDNEYHPL